MKSGKTEAKGGRYDEVGSSQGWKVIVGISLDMCDSLLSVVSVFRPLDSLLSLLFPPLTAHCRPVRVDASANQLSLEIIPL